MSSSILNRIRSDSLPMWLPVDLDAWTPLWIALLITGVLRGLGICLVGGGWFRARLWLSGVRDKCWNQSLRLYIGGRFVEQTFPVALLAVGVFVYDTPSEFIRTATGPAGVIVGSLLLLWGGVIPFLGARAIFKLNAWAWLWLLALPLIWRLALVVVGSWIMTSTGPNGPGMSWNEPGTTMHRGPVFTVAVDEAWLAFDRPDGADLASPDGQATWSATIVRSAEADAAALALVGTDNPTRATGRGTIGRWTGIRLEHRTDDRVVVVHDCPLDAAHRVLFRLEAPATRWDEVYPDLERAMASAYVVDPRIIGVDAARMTPVDMGLVSLRAPDNWILHSYEDDTERHGPVAQTTVDSPGAAEFFVLAYRSDRTARELFEESWEEVGDWHELERERPIRAWRGVPCTGIVGTGRTSRGMPVKVTLMVFERPNRARVEIVTVSAPHEPASLLEGLRLFEESVVFSDAP